MSYAIGWCQVVEPAQGRNGHVTRCVTAALRGGPDGLQERIHYVIISSITNSWWVDWKPSQTLKSLEPIFIGCWLGFNWVWPLRRRCGCAEQTAGHDYIDSWRMESLMQVMEVYVWRLSDTPFNTPFVWRKPNRTSASIGRPARVKPIDGGRHPRPMTTGFIGSLIHWFTDSLIHWFTDSLTDQSIQKDPAADCMAVIEAGDTGALQVTQSADGDLSTCPLTVCSIERQCCSIERRQYCLTSWYPIQKRNIEHIDNCQISQWRLLSVTEQRPIVLRPPPFD